MIIVTETKKSIIGIWGQHDVISIIALYDVLLVIIGCSK